MWFRNKSCLSLLLISLWGLNHVTAQREFSNAFQKGIVLLDLHSSLGIYRKADKNFLSTRLPIFIGAEYGLTNQISAGLFGGWNQRSYKPPGSLIYDVNYYYYGLRFNFHLTELLSNKTALKLEPSRFDLYAGLWAGRQTAKTLTFSGLGFNNSGAVNLAGIHLGARIYTLYRVAVMAEIGLCPYGVLNIGIATRL
ncbi:MAG: hypothetical protein IT240_07075 [Bacteroidia bacterium]|jgi:hypothetical protein|nr:hypothetical protein [Bacteroidia bacterium]MCC6768788.1 hypothetical protein [Bacteroidia bacterium]